MGKKTKPTRRNPVAGQLRNPIFRQRVVNRPDRKDPYSRKKVKYEIELHLSPR